MKSSTALTNPTISSLPTLLPRPIAEFGLWFKRASLRPGLGRPTTNPVDWGPRIALPPLKTTKSAPSSGNRRKLLVGGSSAAASTTRGTPARRATLATAGTDAGSIFGGVSRLFIVGDHIKDCRRHRPNCVPEVR